MNNQKTYSFHVKGMHCRACTVLIESELKELPGVARVEASLRHHSVEVAGNFGSREPEDIAAFLSGPIKKHGYTLSVEKEVHRAGWGDFRLAVPIALGFAVLFVLLQKLGVVNLVNTGNVGYGTAFVVGLIASVSTCMAIVGGLVLSISANFAKEGDKIRPQMLFHAGRIVSFFVLGGVIGALGSAFQLGSVGVFVLSLLVGLVMLVLGINLLDVFPWAKKLQPTMPKFFSSHLMEIKKINHTLTPLLVGVLTFFLPCGFTQSMQLYALSTGNFWSGALTMLSFSLGTLPVLALLSFTSLGIHNKMKSGIFFKTAGLVVIFFALFNIINSLAAIGLIRPIFNF
ncbi:MAG: sulfite exporter TauE/SafE family protein [Candidatus Paceibacterota bacterium]|jgi:sulfite exporter TauE/SafE/copper chaperone CopZ